GLGRGEHAVEQEALELLLTQGADLGRDVGAAVGALGEAEEVTGGDGERGAGGGRLGAKLGARLLGLGLAQAVDLDLARAALEQLAADGDADEAIAAEDEDLLACEVHLRLLPVAW